MMGMTMVIGIVTEVGIFYFSEQREVEPGRALPHSLILAGQNRMRPIAMTTLAAILTLLPLALLAMPAFYALMQRDSRLPTPAP